MFPVSKISYHGAGYDFIWMNSPVARFLYGIPNHNNHTFSQPCETQDSRVKRSAQ